MSRHRKLDTHFQVERLERKHVELKARIADLDRHVFLSAQEQQHLNELKKEKLAAKDALVGLRRPRV
ncbi:MAG: DUF465 domain-containing protein [Polyangiales bacterium]